MSKSSQSTNFRKVNVDDLDEDRFQDDAAETQETVGPSEGAVQELLNGKKNTDALKLVLKDPPYNAGAKEKSRLLALLLRVLSQYKSNDVEGTVKQLSPEELDILLKFIYKGFSEPSDSSCGSLLSWHEKVVSVGGVGSIMRVLTDRKSV